MATLYLPGQTSTRADYGIGSRPDRNNHPHQTAEGTFMLAKQWLKNFVITPEDVEDITNYLLEKETPMLTRDLALYLINKRLEQERALYQKRFKIARLYNPAETHAVGDKLLFGKWDLALGVVKDKRQGNNPTYGDFKVITVEFSDSKEVRQFASEWKGEHPLVQNPAADSIHASSQLTAQEIFDAAALEVTGRMLEALHANKDLKQVAGYWFPKDLVLDIDIGTLHLAEAVLDMNNGGPLTPEQIIEQIGGLGSAPLTLQTFSLNLAMSQDKRFDEVGPAGRVLWFLKRMEPEAVQRIPEPLIYRPIEYDEDLLDEDMLDLEAELDDELSDIEMSGRAPKARVRLIYPHRRVGSLPLNAQTKQIFPTARTPRISITLVDETDKTRYPGWVVHEHRYVYGLLEYYDKHQLPVGTFITVRRGAADGEYIISYTAHRARVEYIPVFAAYTDRIVIENGRRSIGADYDPLLIVDVEDLKAIEALTKFYQNKALLTIVRGLVQELSKLSPQGTVHFATIYSAVNVLRRCPPGPIFALLQANAEFEDVGDHYWRMSQGER